jgi:hypothetical protein
MATSENLSRSECLAEILAHIPGPDSFRRSKRWPILVLVLVGSVLAVWAWCLWFLIQVAHKPLDLIDWIIVALLIYPFLLLATPAVVALARPLITADAPGNPKLESVTKILALFPGHVTLRAPASFMIVALVFLVPMFVLMSWALSRSVQAGDAVASGTIALFGAMLGLCAFLFAVGAAKRLPRITLDAEGFSIHYPWGVTRKRWAEASQFKPGPISGVMFLDASRPSGRLARLWRSANASRSAVPNVFIKKEPLARLMNAWRELALAPPYGSSSVSQ